MKRKAVDCAAATLDNAKKPDEPALVTALFSRRLAQPIAALAVKCGVPANAVTILGGLCWVVSLPLAPLAGWCLGTEVAPGAGVVLWLACCILWNAGYILDVADGSVARMTHTSSRAGFFLDYVFHLLFKPAFLASVGLGLAFQSGSSLSPEWFSISFFSLVALALLSVPANGSAASSAAEAALCGETACGRLKPDGAARPALWLGSADVSDSAALKRRTPLRAARTIAQEVASYYLQAPFFSLLVCVDLAFGAARARGLAPARLDSIASFNMFPVTTAVFAALGIVLIARIPVRLASQWRRLGRATRVGRAGRAAFWTSAALVAISIPFAAAAPLVALDISIGGGSASAGEAALRRILALSAALWLIAYAGLALGRGLSRRSRMPIHNRYLQAVVPGMLVPTAFLAHGFGLWLGIGFEGMDPVSGPLGLLCLTMPFLATGACFASETATAAHVVCEEIGKGRLRPDSPDAAPGTPLWRAAAPDGPQAPASPRLALLLLAVSAATDIILGALQSPPPLPRGAVFLATCIVLAAGMPSRIRSAYALLHSGGRNPSGAQSANNPQPQSAK